MRYVFCSLTTLPPRARAKIYYEMSWDCGAMKDFLEEQCPYMRMCLVYQGRELVAWSLLDLHSQCADTGNLGVMAWTVENKRGKGLATLAIANLLRKHRIAPGSIIDCFSEETAHICEKLGYEVEKIST